METERLKARGVSGTDKQRLTSLDIVMTTIENQIDGNTVTMNEGSYGTTVIMSALQEEGLEEVESSLPLSLSVTIPDYSKWNTTPPSPLTSPHLTPQPSPPPPHPSSLTFPTSLHNSSPLTPHLLHLTPHLPHLTPHLSPTSLLNSSPLTPHLLHLIPHLSPTSLHNSSPLTPHLLHLTPHLPPFAAVQGRHVVYTIHVECRHCGVDIVESWSTARQFSDFHDLHMSLRNMVWVT